MKIAVYGATGMVGREVVAEATMRGHEVRGFSRSGAPDVTAADLTDTATFVKVAADHDAVVVAVSPDRTGGSHEPIVAAFADIVAAVPASRLFVVGGAGSLEIDGVALVDDPDFPAAYLPEARTMTQVLAMLRTDGGALDWTLISPAPTIAPGERTATYRVALDSPAGDSISSQDFAVAILDELEKPAHQRERFTVAN
jgi:putative NADH-flavin reductase